MPNAYPVGPPVLKGTLSFSVKAIPGGALHGVYALDETKAASRADEIWMNFCASVQVPLTNSIWVEIDFDSPKFQALVPALRDLLAREPLEIHEAEAWFGLSKSASAEAGWHAIYGWTEPKPITFLRGEYRMSRTQTPPCRADKAPPGVHIMANLVSEKFKAVVEAHGFSGAEFFWMQDVGKCKAMQWYKLVPQYWLGNGFDHPWFDPATADEDQKKQRGRRAGVGQFRSDQLRSNVAFDEHWKNDFIQLCGTGRFEFGFPKPLLHEFLPQSDFAETSNGHVCVTRRVLEVLLRERLIQQKETGAILVTDTAPPDVNIYDTPDDRMRPLVSPEELRLIKDNEAKLWAKHLANPKPPRVPSLDRSLKLLKRAKKNAPDDFGRKASPADIASVNAALPYTLPAAWEKVLAVAEVFSFAEGEFEVVLLSRLAEYQKEVRDGLTEEQSEIPSKALFFTQGAAGDFHCFDLDSLQPDGECRVLLISHETNEPEAQWPSIAEFIEETFSGEPAEE